jgi:hypothetical protein
VTTEDASRPFDRDFSVAANALASPSDKSPIVKTKFGYHLVFLAERLPELRVPPAEVRRALFDEVIIRRAKRDHAKTLDALRKSTPLEVSRAAADLTGRVRVGR